MNSHADELTRICADALEAIGIASDEEVRAFDDRLARAVENGVTGGVDELRRALTATTVLIERVELARRDLEDRLDHIGEGRRAHASYGIDPVARPLAIDTSA